MVLYQKGQGQGEIEGGGGVRGGKQAKKNKKRASPP